VSSLFKKKAQPAAAAPVEGGKKKIPGRRVVRASSIRKQDCVESGDFKDLLISLER
jgi:hypothetical protein